MTGKEIPFETIGDGCLIYGRQENGEYVIRDQKALKQLYSGMYPPCPIPEQKPKSPKIDFDKEMVIAIFMGECPSGGYAVSIDDIKEKENGLEVLLNESEPESESVVSMGVTYPVHIVKIAKYDGPVSFTLKDN